MSDSENPSERLVLQRVRNRVMEIVLNLSEGDAGVFGAWAPPEWFESFFDWFPYEGEPERNHAMTLEEHLAVLTVCKLMQDAIVDPSIPKSPTFEEIIRSGWPSRIAPSAKQALDLMMKRGRFSEEQEEDEPSTPIPWP